MGKAYEITVWKPHTGKRGEFIKSMKEVAAIFKENGVRTCSCSANFQELDR